MKKPIHYIKELILYGFGALVLLSLLSVFTSEYTGKWSLNKNATQGTELSKFQQEYGEGTYFYPSWNFLPNEYQELFDGNGKRTNEYYAYQMEGLPSYWGFIVSVEKQTQKIESYAYIGAIAIKPIKNEI